MTHSISVREAAEADAPRVLALRKAIFAETDFMLWEPSEFKDTAVDEAARIKRLNGAPNSRFLVALAESDLVGFCLAMGGSVNRLRHSATLALGVVQDYSSQGVGSALLASVFKWSKTAQVTRLELTVHTTNLRAVNLYLRSGFEVEGLRRQSLLVNGRLADEYLMSRLTRGEA
jgi:RimJ/RimL family protein N-acetyltransferase